REGLREEPVHRVEGVVDERGVGAGTLGDAPGAHRRVALLQHQYFGGVEERGPGARVVGAAAARGRVGRRRLASAPPWWGIPRLRGLTATLGSRFNHLINIIHRLINPHAP